MSVEDNRILFEPTKIGRRSLMNRIVMAPMTRNRARPDHVPTPIMAAYYAARATAGLIISEGTSPSPNGVGYARIPGLYSQEQAREWRKATDAVHDKGGTIFVQLMHTGRVAHPFNMPDGARILAPSSVPLEEEQFTDQAGPQLPPPPEAMSFADIEDAQTEFATSARMAIEVAGFDGVELHGANGYLLDAFLNPRSNQRDDAYGGDRAGRLRFLFETVDRVANQIGADRCGLRLSPFGVFNGVAPHDGTHADFVAIAQRMKAVGLAYLHVLEDLSALGGETVPADLLADIGAAFGGPMMLNGGYDGQSGARRIADGAAELISFGRPFIANPDVVAKLAEGLPFNQPDPATFYTPGPEGYL